MVQTDSNRTVVDSLKAVIDSLQTDTLQSRVDSVAVDTLHSLVPFTGRSGIELLSTPQSEPFVFILLLLLLFFPIIVYRMSAAVFTESLSMLFKVKDRNSMFSKATSSDAVLRNIMFLFFIIVSSCHIYLFYISEFNAQFNLEIGARFFVVTLAFFILKIGIISLLVYVFFGSSLNKAVLENYLNILSVCGVVLYPLLVMKVYCPPEFLIYLNIASLIVLFLSIVFVFVKMLQIFFSKFIDLFYILLYLCTLEIIPVFYLFRVYLLMV